MKLIVGLGNPGPQYASNRHNVGFRCVDRFAKERGAAFTRKKPDYQMAEVEIAGEKVLLLKPRTFMNESGRAVAPVARFYRISLSDLLVIYDDLDLPVGKVRIRPGGSSAGHRGVQSIIEALGSEEFPRIRVGIGRPEERGQDAVSYVLGGFTAQEEDAIQKVVERVSEAVLVLVQEGLDKAMNRFNPL
ncbi:MAG: aminoacyl-tRNA hydrolase [Chloroflexi bacterium]|nr:aminoacyl-tRNA hydrolase [Chloroflexota bacterium]